MTIEQRISALENQIAALGVKSLAEENTGNYYISVYSGEQIDSAVQQVLEGGVSGDFADKQLSNLDTPQLALSNLGAGVRPNLLINPIFQVNQRGKSSYTGSGYTVDGLAAVYGTQITTVNSDGTLTLQNTSSTEGAFWESRIENLKAGKKYTLSVLARISEGSATSNTALRFCRTQNIANAQIPSSDQLQLVTLTATCPDSISDTYPNLCIRVDFGRSVQIAAIKLEEGETQTLAYQDPDGTWQLLPQPESDYGTQLAKCQRYQLRLPYGASQNFAPIGFGWAQNATTFRMLIPTPVTMRANPIISYLSGDLGGVYIICNGSSIAPTAIASIIVQEYGVAIEITASGGTANAPCVMRMTNAYMMLDANL